MYKSVIARKIGLLIFGFDLLLFMLLIFFKLFNWMDSEEFNETLVLMAPIRGLYIGNILKYLMAEKSFKETTQFKSKFYANTVITLVVLHFISVIGVIFIFGLGGSTDLIWLRNSLAFIETFFGIYLSQIIPDLFSLQKKAVV